MLNCKKDDNLLEKQRYPALDINNARQIANDHKREIALGNDPKAMRDEKFNVLSFEEFAELHYLPYARMNQLTAKNDIGNLKLHFYPKWGKKSIKLAYTQTTALDSRTN